MYLFRATEPRIFNFLDPKLLEDPHYPKKKFVRDFSDFMLREPDKSLVLVLVEEQELIGYLVAAALDEENLFIVQVYMDSHIANTRWPRRVLEETENFARDLRLKRLRAETRRSPEAFLRKWGFETATTIICKEIDYGSE